MGASEVAFDTEIGVTVDRYSIPVLWIDTFALIDLGRMDAVKSLASNDALRLAKLREVVVSKVRDGRLICVEGDQDEEVEVGRKFLDPIRAAMLRLSFGVRIWHRYQIRYYQLYRMMEAYLSKSNSVVLHWKNVFKRDPAKELRSNRRFPFLIRADMPTPDAVLDQARLDKAEHCNRLEAIRLDSIAKGRTYADQLAREKCGVLDAVRVRLAEISHKDLSDEQVVREIHRRLWFMYGPFLDWKSVAGRGGSLNGFIQFLSSKYFRASPYEQVSTCLYADLLTGEAKIKKGDAMDIEHLSTVIPYCHFVLTDRSMCARVKRRKLDVKYNTHVFSMRHFDEFVGAIEAL